MNRISAVVVVLFLVVLCFGPAESAPKAEPIAPRGPAAGVTLTYAADPADIEIVTPAGRTVFIDVYAVGNMSRAPTAQDILLTTHLHSDHYSASVADAFPGRQLLAENGKIELPDVTITGIAAAHNSDDPIVGKGGTDYIYIIETGGVRIVHFGDLGQDALTAEQLAVIGKVEVAISQLSNSYSDVNADNLKGFNLMEQVEPRLFIPTHSDRDTIKMAVERWKGFYSTSRTIAISAATLPPARSVLLLGSMAGPYGRLFNLRPWQ